ncbi:MAG: rhodanese-like domain-containing protein, partial [Desulfuromonadaceae bacterium]
MSDDLTITMEQALVLRDQGALLVDVRTPAEFAEATIPGAINVPIFSDAERVEIGTLYKQQGKQIARRRGVQLVAPKIPTLLEQVESAWRQGSGPVIVFCWRGGMRTYVHTSASCRDAHASWWGHDVLCDGCTVIRQAPIDGAVSHLARD